MTVDGSTAGARPDAETASRPRVKICGLTRPADVDAAIDAGADAVGVVCDVPIETPREVTAERAADLIDRVPSSVTSVLVTMVTDVERVSRLAGRVDPDAIQLHGGVGVGELASLRSRLDALLFVAVDAGADEVPSHYDELADALVIDSVDESGAGGTGETHDWRTTEERAASLASPVVLAGGLTPSNVARAVAVAHPFAVDVSTGIETAAGVKDHDAVRTFVERARAASVETERP
ncbi:phosphoribosylanthranilate isomerase [Halovivax cerinus]|uniref:N-(5'-phosphoribosyl)anthranilate isomerase n=1 Tax=Halovivax cerinus TaxID=1487865 RepID=A0ABD5NMR9_9EURY|nr:phosphoribosylanthranilate isomerase [Halovivax cerinus]